MSVSLSNILFVYTGLSAPTLSPASAPPALSKAFGNFDRVVALGWLVADALGAPLLTREAAYDIGMTASS